MTNILVHAWKRSAATALLLLLAHGAQAAPCAILGAEDIASAFGDRWSWTLESGGAGACQFSGVSGSAGDRTIVPAQLHVVQTFHPTAAAAAATMRAARAAAAKAGAVADLSFAGIEPGAFRYRLQGATVWTMQVGRATVDATYLLAQVGADAAPPPEMTAVLQKVAIGTGAPAAAVAAGRCPAVDEAFARQLLGGTGIRFQQAGSTECMIVNDKSDVVGVSIAALGSEDGQQQRFESDAADAYCRMQPVPALGRYGRITFGCSAGVTPHAAVSFGEGLRHYEYRLIRHGREPSPQEREQLIELARRPPSR